MILPIPMKEIRKNYLVATSPEVLLAHLRRLKEDLSFRDELVASGHHQGNFYTQQKTEERWNLLLKETIAKFAHTHVRKTPRQLFSMLQKHRFFLGLINSESAGGYFRFNQKIGSSTIATCSGAARNAAINSLSWS